jgi:hypothetical protein
MSNVQFVMRELLLQDSTTPETNENARLAVLNIEAYEWGISVTDRLELETLARQSLVPLEKFAEIDHEEFEFRGKVAEVLVNHGLKGKAWRYLDCARRGYRLVCEGPERHEFFSPLYCDLRFCRVCAPRRFARLFAKHAPVLEFIARNPRQNFRLREITLTSRNLGDLKADQIKQFNRCVKKTLKTLLKDIPGWGAIWVNEVGFNNTNLHAHVLAYCPYIEQAQLADTWREISGHQVVWINQAKILGSKALLYLLKYVSKPPADDPETIGALVVAFHGTRRVHALGVFYNFVGDDPDGLESQWGMCPKCGANLVAIRELHPVSDLRSYGLEFIGEFPSSGRRREWVN